MLTHTPIVRFLSSGICQHLTVKYHTRSGFDGCQPLSPMLQGAIACRSWAIDSTPRRTPQQRYFSNRSNARLRADDSPESETGSAVQDTASNRSGVDVRIIDYSNENLASHTLDSDSLGPFLQEQPKPSWSACRWIYVNGLDQHTMKCLGEHKNLHPLALEDVLDTTTMTKVDWYENHCYLEMKIVKLVNAAPETEFDLPQSKDETSMHSRALEYNHSMRYMRSRKKSAMRWGQASVFLTDDNTIITIFEHSGNDVLAPVMDRLQSSQTVLRSSNDPSMLLHAVIDTIVDLSLPIGKTVAEIFEDLEQAVLRDPSIPQSKQLHILRSGLTLLLDNTNSIGGLIKTLCEHRAIADLDKAPGGSISSKTKPHTSVQISALARMYFHDVQDHIQTLSNSTQMSIRSAENLSTLIFNSITASQNESLRKLTLVSSFFLPLTFLTSYFGMNFESMPSVNDQSEVFFWLIATPVMFGTLLLLTVGTRTMSWARRVKSRLSGVRKRSK